MYRYKRAALELEDEVRTQIQYDGDTYEVRAGWQEESCYVEILKKGERIHLTNYNISPSGVGLLDIPADCGPRYKLYLKIEKWLQQVYDDEGQLIQANNT